MASLYWDAPQYFYLDVFVLQYCTNIVGVEKYVKINKNNLFREN